MRSWLLVALFTAGCGDSSNSGETDLALPKDQAVAFDLVQLVDSTVTSDLAALDLTLPDLMLQPDLTTLLPPGSDCSSDGDCQSGLCRAVVILSSKVCVAPCTAQSDCAGYLNLFCEATVPGSTSGYCIPRSPSHCLSCTQDSDCGSLSEKCARGPSDVAVACHVDCALGGAAACPPDYTCTTSGASAYCQPNVGVCNDAFGGYCDRLNLPQPCSRSNTNGTCVGQRTCISTAKRFDSCNAQAPACRVGCTPNPAGCMEICC